MKASHTYKVTITVVLLGSLALCLWVAYLLSQPVVEEPTPKPPVFESAAFEPMATAVPREEPEPSGLELDGTGELVELIKAYGTPPIPRGYRGDFLFGATNVGWNDNGVVDRILYTNLPDSLIGSFDPAILVPGTIVNCMPFVRSDLTGHLETLNTLKRKAYSIHAVSLSANQEGANLERLSWQIPAGSQDSQRREAAIGLETFMNSRYSDQSFMYRSPMNVQVFETRARNVDEAKVKAGLSASVPIKDIDLGINAGTGSNSESRKMVALGIIRQEYFQLRAFSSEEGHGPAVYIETDSENVEALQKGISSNSEAPGIPALVTSVTYGRLILFAYQQSTSADKSQAGLGLTGKWGKFEGSLDIGDDQSNQETGETARLWIVGGSGVPESLNRFQPVGGEDNTHYHVPLADLSATITAIVNETSEWKGEPGVPISVQFTLLDGSTTLRPFLISYTDVTRATLPNLGWEFDVWADIKGCFDPGLFGSGEWDFKLLLGGKELLAFNQGVKSGEKFWVTSKAKKSVAQQANVFAGAPVKWEESFNSFSIKVTEDDLWPNDDDCHDIAFEESMTLERPEAYSRFEESAKQAQESLADLSHLFTTTMKVERASKTASKQESMHDTWKKGLEDLRTKLVSDQHLFQKLDSDAQLALTALSELQNVGVSIVGKHGNGNTFRIVGRPNLSGYVLHVEQIRDSVMMAYNNISGHVRQYAE